MKRDTLTGNLACFAAYALFGFNIISCKRIALDGNITPMALFCLRSFGAAVLFWLWSLFIAYFLILYGQKRLRPVVVCMYTYVQPVIAMVIALVMGLDTLGPLKIAATLLVFLGVGLVNFVPKKRRPEA